MTASDVSTKICSKCKQEKPFTEFYKACNYAGGVKSECKICFNKRNMQNYVYKNIQEKVCMGCGTKFLPNLHQQKYCTVQCRIESQSCIKKEPQKKNCVRCGSEFIQTRYGQDYCSNDCYKKTKKEINVALSQTEGLTKACFTCGTDKPLSEYNKQYTARYGVMNHCKECEKKKFRIETYGNNQTTKCVHCGNEFERGNDKKYCSDKCKRAARTIRQGGIPQPNRKVSRNNPVIDGKKQCTVCGENRPLSEYYLCKSTGRHHTYCNHCRKIKGRVMSRIRKKMDRTGEKLRRNLKQNPNNHHSLMNLDYSIADLRTHLEKQFTKGMNWDKFNKSEIHIDHIIPIASFDLSNPEEWRSCWGLPNLRPMWAKSNLEKRAKILTLL